ncbi:MAG: dihydrobiliverdin:ferredoxin oxidoreductase [Prochlorococcus sp. SP3034]|nr:dihydrobiliverdin:ferredoxin oxidoreductase [Prochlorococcus sp. SP3034]|tara:strand:- start:1584 stop:2285 length:702 start_codon:yes stop_codon:yes gene_type:complete
MFESLFDLLDENIKKRNGIKVQLSDEFSEYYAKESNCLIKNSLFELTDFRKWRITKLDAGKKLQVLNTVAYPTFNSEIPILGVDILWFGNSQKLLAVLDYQPLIQEEEYLNKYCSRLKFIKNKYSEFNNTKMKNIYDENKYFSPWVIICRGNKSNLESDLNNIFTQFLEEYLKMNDKNKENNFLNVQQIKNSHINYDKYSAERDPAEKLFKSFFGEIWTRNFLRNYLFTLSEN